MCLSEQSLRDVIRAQAQQDYHCSHWRKVRGDGDCYYRAVGFRLFERAFGAPDDAVEAAAPGGGPAAAKGRMDEATKLITVFKTVRFDSDARQEKQEHDKLVKFMERARRKGSAGNHAGGASWKCERRRPSPISLLDGR